jgi:outer membrane protein assembly factor BamB
VLVAAYCPECRTRYQLKGDLVGRKIRCTTASCQAVFVVQPSNDGPAPLAAEEQRSAGAANDLLEPIVGDGPVRARNIPEELDWRTAPPPVRGAETAKSPTPRSLPLKGRRERKARPLAPRFRFREGATGDQGPSTESRRRIGVFVVGIFTLIVAGSIGGIIYTLVRAYAHDEQARRTAAEQDYARGAFRSAANAYHELADKHGRSEHAAEYRLLADLSDLREAASPPIADPGAALARAQSFTKKYDALDPKLKSYRDDVSRAITAVAETYADSAAAAAARVDEAARVPDLIRGGREALDLLRRYPPKDSARLPALDERLGDAAVVADRARDKARSVDEVLKLLAVKRPDLDAARRLAQRQQVLDEPAVRQALHSAEEQSVREVTYQRLERPAQPAGPGTGPPVLLLETATGHGAPPTEVVFAVARGLLYALDARDGRRLWACRVGLDSPELPARIAATADDPDLILVATSDPPGLTARDVRTGVALWHQPLEAPCLGRPVADGRGRVFVPTSGPAGMVYDVDARNGLFHGRFETRQTLAAGGAFDALTRRFYVPAHGASVFVFQYGEASPRCEGLLPTGHPAGSLRGEPIVVSADEGLDVPRYLVLGQADGLDAMTLHAFRLRDTPTESPVDARARLPGWSWFPPYHDPETIALVTDAGAIGLFGIQQKGDDDPPLFPLVDPDGGAAARDRKGGDRTGEHPPVRSRAQIVSASESGFWVLADGVLRHWRLGLTRQSGRRLTPAWGDGLRLGAPLHAAQVSADRHTLFVVTQSDSPPSCRATAVDAVSGELVWQRPLGLAPAADPVVLGGAVVVLDQSGAIYRFAEKDEGKKGSDTPLLVHPSSFFTGGREIAPPENALAGRSYLLPSADGRVAWSLSVRADEGGMRLVVRRVDRDGAVTGGSVPLSAPLAGAPALGPNAAVMPLADGQLFRVALEPTDLKPALGPTWRPPGVRPDTRGEVVHISGDEFLVSDGNRRLWHLTWRGGSDYQLDSRRPLELSAPLARLGEGAVIAVADTGGAVSLVRGDRPVVVRSWRPGPVTAGPWTVGDRLAFVVDRRKLVWLNPEADQPVWVYASPGDGIEAPPRLVDGKLIVADLAGRFVALDPANGKPLGGGYQFPAEAAPAGPVAAFGNGRLFAPLTDGSVLVLPLTELAR